METMIVDNGHVTVMLTMPGRDNALVPELLIVVGKYYYVNCSKFMVQGNRVQLSIRGVFRGSKSISRYVN